MQGGILLPVVTAIHHNCGHKPTQLLSIWTNLYLLHTEPFYSDECYVYYMQQGKVSLWPEIHFGNCIWTYVKIWWEKFSKELPVVVLIL